MSSAKLAVACSVAAVAISACGSSTKPVAGSSPTTAKPTGRGVVDDPRIKHVNCLRQHHLSVTLSGHTDIQIGAAPAGPSVTFTPTPGAAQQAQITGQIQGAEVIGSALLYPHQGSDTELKVIEDCLAEGVKG